MRSVLDFNGGWSFSEGFAPALAGSAVAGTPVHLPHTAVELPFSYFDETAYQREFTYRKAFDADPAWAGQEVVLAFDGAMANAVVYLNGEPIAAHQDGYTPFEARLTGRLKPEGNLLAVKLDGAENPSIPPFGGQIDYLTYAGLYREAWLRVTPPISIGAVKIETPDVLAAAKTVRVRVEIDNPQNLPLGGTLVARLLDAAGTRIAETSASVSGDAVALAFEDLRDIALWGLAAPSLYTLELSLGDDTSRTRFGFREARFATEGFLLNGEPLKLRGLNRHQSFPYVGYALGRAAQERDAEILKHQLHVNIVRTSHYPQSPWFLERCDELGLLVFEEIPGWQHIGDDAWQAEAIENVRRMIRRDWNHPSIVLWGVRINESQDSHDFYLETNRLARALDPTRQTGGVRFITDSDFLEDVFTLNDFILGNEELGGNRPRTPLRPVAETTGLATPVP
jgi:beta-galactosidase